MSRSYVLNFVHCVFSTKGRAQLIRDPAPLYAYFGGIARNCGFHILAVGGMENHVHLLLSIPPGHNLCEIMRDLKANSSRHLREKCRGFAWQDGYGAISVSPSQLEAVKHYIAHQQGHHRNLTFDDEYLAILTKAGARFERDHVLG